MGNYSIKIFIIGISGVSCSGKTTLAKLFQHLLPNVFILHQDDFFKAEEELPSKYGFKDGDCAEAIKIPELVAALEYIRNNGTYPQGFQSIEDASSFKLESVVSESTLSTVKSQISSWISPGNPGNLIFGTPFMNSLTQPAIFIMEGILLYPSSMSQIHHYLDVKLFLQSKYATAKARRDARPPYVTKDGVWVDPPGYFDTIVWGNYREDHSWMFEAGDVDGEFNKERLRDDGIEALSESDGRVDRTLVWAVDTLIQSLEKLINHESDTL